MKNNKLKSLLLMMVILFGTVSLRAQNIFPSSGSVGIGITTPNSFAALDIDTIGKGLLIPRMTKSQRDAIGLPGFPPIGLLIYQTNNTPGFYYYSGSAWTAVTPKKGWLTTGNGGTTPSTNFFGTTDAIDLRFRTNNLERLTITSAGSVGIGTTSPAYKLDVAGDLNIGSTLSSSLYIGHDKVLTMQGNNDNIFVGAGSGVSNTGTSNTFLGAESGKHTTTGNYNTYLGFQAGLNSTTPSNNTFVGNFAGLSNRVGYNNSVFGASAGENLDTASQCSIFGYSAGQHCTGAFNSFFGASAGQNNTSGTFNNFFGQGAGMANTTGSANCFYGTNSGAASTTGINNSFIGVVAGAQNTIGERNTFVGNYSGYFSNTANWNTFFGFQAGYITTGGDNAIFGEEAGMTNTGGSGITLAGNLSNVSTGNLINATAIGYGASVNASNKVRIGNASVSVVEGQVPYSFPSDGRFKINVQENVKGLEFINKLRPVTYNFETKKFDEFIHQNETGRWKDAAAGIDYSSSEKIVRSGFIAQEVEKAAKDVDYEFDGVHAPQNDQDNYSLSYELLVVPMVKALQELSERNDELKSENEELKSRLSKIETMLGVNDEGKVSSGENEKVLLEGNTGYSLGQNVPNPFMSKTTIPYSVPSTVSSASIVFQNEHGVVLKTIELKPGSGTVEVETRDLSSGVYQYSLMIDGKIVSTKQMELLK